ncbi:MAG: hypothetical protein LW688_02620 [Cryomorphaceae bacterium]|jgi:hypothetical protein|nr:hypothetical protein [Cryomorphaceae bacterium]
MHRFIYIYFLAGVFSVTAQSKTEFVLEELPADSLLDSSIKNHPSVKPVLAETIRHTAERIGRKGGQIGIQGITDAAFFASSSPTYRTGAGVLLEFSPTQKWYARLAGIQGITNSSGNLFPNTYLSSSENNFNTFTDLRGRVSFSPNSIFNFQAGLDKNFIGEGSRSLFLSDYGKAYPFGMVRTKFWRVEYSVVYQFFREETNKGWLNKNGATHHISFNAAKWLNFGIFESVIFLPKDTMLNRGYDAEYLNPIVFYRPQEYSMGSSDNVLLGASFSADWKENTFYGQLILDEFFLAEIKAKSGWWANKYGGQLGIKGRFKKRAIPLFYRIEYNTVRPYTYAHLNSGQNYGNSGATLAHPMGSNFMEILGELKGQKGKWNAKLFVSYFLQGLDKNGLSYGSDIYQPYTNRPYEYGHFIGQGNANNGLRALLHVGYCLHKATNLHVFVENQLRFDSAFDSYTYIGALGIRSQLWNDYRNY